MLCTVWGTAYAKQSMEKLPTHYAFTNLHNAVSCGIVVVAATAVVIFAVVVVVFVVGRGGKGFDTQSACVTTKRRNNTYNYYIVGIWHLFYR